MVRSLYRSCPVTIVVSLVVLVIHFSPTLTQWLQLDFAAVASGQWWRIWTGHLTHYGGQHLFWDLLMFTAFGIACERKHRGRFVPFTALMAAGISSAIFWWCPDIGSYRGLSGLDTGLFLWFIVDQCRECWLGRDRLGAGLWLLPAVGLIAKLSYEAATGQVLFVDAGAFTPLVESHCAGAALGLICSVLVQPGSHRGAGGKPNRRAAVLPRIWSCSAAER